MHRTPRSRCDGWSRRVDPIITFDPAPRAFAPRIRQTAGAPARSVRATAVLFAFGSLLTLVDALMTHALLRQDGFGERWTPVRALMDAVGLDLALAICAVLAVGAMAAAAWGSVRARPTVASLSFVVLCAAVAIRVCGCVNNFGVMLS